MQPTAQEMAQSVMEREHRLERNSAAAQQEQQEKARLRHKHALAQVRLEREKEEVLDQLKVRQGAARPRYRSLLASSMKQPLSQSFRNVGSIIIIESEIRYRLYYGLSECQSV